MSMLRCRQRPELALYRDVDHKISQGITCSAEVLRYAKRRGQSRSAVAGRRTIVMITLTRQFGADVGVTEKQESPTQRLRALLADQVKRVQERLFARRVCSESLAAFHAVRKLQPELTGDDLYEAAIASRMNLDAAGARAIVRRTHSSLEDWDSDRGPSFRDVVKYMIVSEYLGQETDQRGMSLDLGPFLAKRIDLRF